MTKRVQEKARHIEMPGRAKRRRPRVTVRARANWSLLSPWLPSPSAGHCRPNLRCAAGHSLASAK